jgi:hypothetical protein
VAQGQHSEGDHPGDRGHEGGCEGSRGDLGGTAAGPDQHGRQDQAAADPVDPPGAARSGSQRHQHGRRERRRVRTAASARRRLSARRAHNKLLKCSLTSTMAASPHGCPGPSTSETNARAALARSARPPGKRHALPDRHPGHHRTRPSPVTPPRGTRRAAGGRGDMHAQLRRERQADTIGLHGPRPWARPCLRPSSVAVRATPTVSRTAPRPRFSSAMRPWTPQYDGSQRYKVTHHGTEKKRPASTRYRS